jgi:hypothetical protein
MNKYCGRVSVISSLLLLVCQGCSGVGMSKSDQILYNQVISRIKSGEIKTDEEGGITPPAAGVRLPQSATLPSDLQAASTNGEIYIFRPSRNQLLVVFSTWRGKGFNIEGYLYTAVPLEPQDTSKDGYGKKVITLGPMDLALDEQLNTNWYRVSYKLD